MLMLLLVAVLIAMMGFALVRHWKVQNEKILSLARTAPIAVVNIFFLWMTASQHCFPHLLCTSYPGTQVPG